MHGIGVFLVLLEAPVMVAERRRHSSQTFVFSFLFFAACLREFVTCMLSRSVKIQLYLALRNSAAGTIEYVKASANSDIAGFKFKCMHTSQCVYHLYELNSDIYVIPGFTA